MRDVGQAAVARMEESEGKQDGHKPGQTRDGGER